MSQQVAKLSTRRPQDTKGLKKKNKLMWENNLISEF